MLKWSKCLYFCVIWKGLLNGIMARGRNTFSTVVNCILKIWKTESTQKWQGHASQVRFISKLCLPQQFVITCGCFIAGHIQFKVELYKATLPVSFPPFLPHLKERGKQLAWFVLRPKRKKKKKTAYEHQESYHNDEVSRWPVKKPWLLAKKQSGTATNEI